MPYDLSLLIPAKNEEFLKKTVEDALSHIEGQTEIIVVLDGYETELPTLPEDPRVRVITNLESVGQRAATNQACRLSSAKYVMKVDAHCAFDQGFDVKMIAEMHDDWTMIPVMRNLHTFDWVCKEGHRRYQGPSGPCQRCGRPTVKDVVWIAKTNPQSTAYCFDEEPHFQYFNDFKKRPEYKEALLTGLTETMSIQGSCFMLTRDKYWELNISDEALGSWGSQGIEVACKTWLSGGRVVTNHNTWYAHMFRTQGGDFGFPYDNPGRKVENAKKTVRELFFDNKWDKQIRPLSWLVEKFWPVSGWTDEMRAKIKAWPLPEARLKALGLPLTPEVVPTRAVASTAEVGKEPTAGILYYTDNQLNMKIARAVRRHISAGGLPITSVTLKPTNFGRNIFMPLERGYLTMFKQILTGLEAMKEDIVFFTEHDTLYAPEYFKFRPADKNTFYYNGNYWFLRMTDGFAIHYNVSPLSGLVVYRETAIKHFRERVAMIEKEGFSYNMGFEPFTHGRIKWDFWCPFEIFMSERPSIDIAHGGNVTKKRWSQDLFRRKPTFWEETREEIPGWGKIPEIMKELI